MSMHASIKRQKKVNKHLHTPQNPRPTNVMLSHGKYFATLKPMQINHGSQSSTLWAVMKLEERGTKSSEALTSTWWKRTRAVSCLSFVQGNEVWPCITYLIKKLYRSLLDGVSIGVEGAFLKKMKVGYLTEFQKWQFWHFLNFFCIFKHFDLFWHLQPHSLVSLWLSLHVLQPISLLIFLWAKETRKETVKMCMLITS